MRPPSVDVLARSLAGTGLPHPVLVDVARDAIAAGDPASAGARAHAVARALLGPVVNATGVLLHTNLGRAPTPIAELSWYHNLEFDVATGRRGSRSGALGGLIARACGAERALVVNNGAAAVMLVLAALGTGREALVSRGELVEIGGGFRLPEVFAASGCRLVEVGTTNRTRLADYRSALTSATAMVLKVHQSNFRQSGFVEMASVRSLAGLGVPVVADVGSGLLDATTPWLRLPTPTWLGEEPAVRQTLRDGAHVVTFSGDKLLGGPQAGIITGRAHLVDVCAAHPLARALRPGGMVLGALQDVVLAYLHGEAERIVFWRMATTPPDAIRRRCESLGLGDVVPVASVPGGGTLPGVEIPSFAVALDGDRTAALRGAPVPVIARVHEGRTLLDLRTVEPEDDARVKDALSCAG